MAVQNDFLPFAVGAGANVLTQAQYAALSAIANGYSSGVAQSSALNKTWRQSSIMAAVISSFIVAQTGQAAIDDGTTATLLSNFTQAVVIASKQRVILADTGTANAYAAANTVPLTALPTASGVVQTVQISHANTGASTYAPDGLAAKPIYGLGGQPLQGSELPANGIATLVSYVGPLLNGGNLCWVLYECIGGAQQVGPATASNHAVQFGQVSAVLLQTAVVTSGVASIDFTGLTDSYKEYVIEVCDLTPANTTAELWVRFHESTGWITSAIYAYAWSYVNGSGTGIAPTSTSDHFLLLNGIATGAGLGVAGRINVFAPHSTTAYRRLTWDFQNANAASTARYVGAGSYTSLNNIDGIRLMLSNGNIATATVKLYGVN